MVIDREGLLLAMIDGEELLKVVIFGEGYFRW